MEQFTPTLNIDPAMWSERLFSDTKIPPGLQDEILALQAMLKGNLDVTAGEGGSPPPTPPGIETTSMGDGVGSPLKGKRPSAAGQVKKRSLKP